ncbi:MAG: amino acid permease [Acidobacteria bacterium]|nr:amino acid permease [Acidobacteriota bacterium]
MDSQTPTAPPVELPRRLGLLDSTNIVVGTMIGSAIFLVPSTIAQNVSSVELTLAIWLIAGLVSMLGALAYAELGAMLPASGGQYVYMREAWGPLTGFLCGWSLFLVARSGATAAVAAGFAAYFTQFVPMPASGSRVVAAALILILTLVNYCGVRLGAGVQNIFTALKVLGLAVMVLSSYFGRAPALPPQTASTNDISAAQLGAALIVCIFSYNGWFAVGMVGGEIKDPERNLPRAIMLGVSVVIVVYLLTNAAYFRTLTISEIAGTQRVAEATAVRTMGAAGSAFVALTILVSTLAATNSTIMSASRLYYAQARDGLFFQSFGKIHPVFETPHNALLGTGFWSAVLALTGSYIQLISYATFSFWVLYGVTVAGLMVRRQRQPDAVRPYRMFGYPVTPIIFLIAAGGVAVFSFLSSPAAALTGVGILAAGVPAYYLWLRFGAPKKAV